MIINSCSRNHLEGSLEVREIPRLLNALELPANLSEVCHVSVTIIFHPIDTEILHAKIAQARDDALDGSLELFPTGAQAVDG